MCATCWSCWRVEQANYGCDRFSLSPRGERHVFLPAVVPDKQKAAPRWGGPQLMVSGYR
jgi:hypothetical protein